MSTKLQSPESDPRQQEFEINDKQLIKNIEQEIECPRCADIMLLSSEFDKLGYVCQECDLLLVIESRRNENSSSIFMYVCIVLCVSKIFEYWRQETAGDSWVG
jgi:hypothetical protein